MATKRKYSRKPKPRVHGKPGRGKTSEILPVPDSKKQHLSIPLNPDSGNQSPHLLVWNSEGKEYRDIELDNRDVHAIITSLLNSRVPEGTYNGVPGDKVKQGDPVNPAVNPTVNPIEGCIASARNNNIDQTGLIIRLSAVISRLMGGKPFSEDLESPPLDKNDLLRSMMNNNEIAAVNNSRLREIVDNLEKLV